MDLVFTIFMFENNPCVLVFTISLILEETVIPAECGTFTVRYGKFMNGVYKTNPLGPMGLGK